MKIIKLEKENLMDIKPLWKELNTLHGKLASNFKEHFDSFTFKSRKNILEKKEKLSIFVASNNGIYIGYCIASIEKEKGEIDSLFIQKEYRNKNIGNQLMKNALEWLSLKGCPVINIHVAEGNELSLGFYEKFGFKKRFTTLQKQVSSF